MPTNLRDVGLDVHAETIAVAVAEPDGEASAASLPSSVGESVGLSAAIRGLGECYPSLHHEDTVRARPCAAS